MAGGDKAFVEVLMVPGDHDQALVQRLDDLLGMLNMENNRLEMAEPAARAPIEPFRSPSISKLTPSADKSRIAWIITGI